MVIPLHLFTFGYTPVRSLQEYWQRQVMQFNVHSEAFLVKQTLTGLLVHLMFQQQIFIPCAYVKSKVYKTPPASIPNSKHRVQQRIEAISTCCSG